VHDSDDRIDHFLRLIELNIVTRVLNRTNHTPDRHSRSILKMPDRKYRQTRQCLSCGHREERTLTELDAAFERTRVWDTPCPKCGSALSRGGTSEVPALSAAQIATWATTRDLSFISQDEDILLARPESWALLLETLDNTRTLKQKKKTLLAALFVIVFDQLRAPRRDPEVIRAVVMALRARKGLINELGTRHLPGSIARRVIAIIAAGDPQ
jgi:hypothetical protein